MVACLLRRAAAACLFCALPVAADPVLDFDMTDFRSGLEYSGGEVARSEPDSSPAGQSLDLYPEGNDPLDNPLQYPGAQFWGVVTAQSPAAGGNPVTLEFGFRHLQAAIVDPGSPLTIAIEGLNTWDLEMLEVVGPVKVEFEVNHTWDSWDLPAGSGWSWEQVLGPRANVYDLIIDFDGQTPADALDGLEADDEIRHMRVSFGLTVPEPSTLGLLAVSALACRRRRR